MNYLRKADLKRIVACAILFALCRAMSASMVGRSLGIMKAEAFTGSNSIIIPADMILIFLSFMTEIYERLII